jgi:hypothetical protein
VLPGAHRLHDLLRDLFLPEQEGEDALAEGRLEGGEVGVLERIERAVLEEETEGAAS